MLFRKVISLSLIGTAIATGRPSSTSICDYYTTGLLKDNTAKNQYALLTLIVNTAVIGNYTEVRSILIHCIHHHANLFTSLAMAFSYPVSLTRTETTMESPSTFFLTSMDALSQPTLGRAMI